MVFEHLVPTKRSEWSFFERQRTIFSSMHKEMEKEWKDFDMELEKIRKDMFKLTPAIESGGLGAGALDFPKMGSGMDLMKSDFMKSDFGDLGNFGASGMDSLLKIDQPFVTDLDGNKKLSIRFDVSQFKPEEISVRTMDNKLMIQAKHTEESPGRKVYREFSKQYILPNKIDPVKLESILSQDGVLSIQAPAPAEVEAPKERILPIQRL